ncbi:hypothetical protein DSECCO2_493260 [anaerobic digester metagenome]
MIKEADIIPNPKFKIGIDKNSNTKQKIALGIIMLFLMYNVINLAISGLSLNKFISCSFVLIGSFLICFALPSIEAMLHEFGHCLSICIIGVFMLRLVYPKISSETSEPSGSTVFKTTSNIDDVLRKNKMYFFIRFYSLGGVLFVFLLCYTAYKLFYKVNDLFDMLIIGISLSCVYHELFSLLNGRKTNDFNVFLHPETF